MYGPNLGRGAMEQPVFGGRYANASTQRRCCNTARAHSPDRSNTTRGDAHSTETCGHQTEYSRPDATSAFARPNSGSRKSASRESDIDDASGLPADRLAVGRTRNR
jgi:hypothetical protein